MSKPGTTWFKSKRKVAALVTGAAILAGTIGVAAPEPETEVASTWSIVQVSTDFDLGGGKVGGDVRVGGTSFRLFSTWS